MASTPNVDGKRAVRSRASERLSLSGEDVRLEEIAESIQDLETALACLGRNMIIPIDVNAGRVLTLVAAVVAVAAGTGAGAGAGAAAAAA